MNVVVFPLRGVFAKHDGPRRRVLGTPSHAVFVAAGQPYRVSYPLALGDYCLTLRFSDAALERAACGDFASLVSTGALTPALLLRRAVLWRRLVAGHCDPLEAEELSAGLLEGALETVGRHVRRSCTGRRRVELVKEAIALHPEQRWTLASLGKLVHVSPHHLAHVFRSEVGLPLHRYLVRARLAKALDAVLDAASDLASVAAEAGFASHSHFTERFRALFGCAPAELRRASARSIAELRKILTADLLAAA